MKHIAIISPCILPVPAVKGGAVESLLTFLVEENEKVEGIKFDLFSIFDDDISNSTYKNTTVYTIKKGPIMKAAERISDKIYRTLPGNVSVKRAFDNRILAEVKRVLTKERYSYDVIVVENQMSLAARLLDSGMAEKSKVFFHMHNDVDIYRSPYYCRKLSRSGVRFICVSEYIKSRVLLYAPDADAAVLYNGTDTTIFDYGLVKKRVETRQKFGIGPDETVFLFSGRIIWQKGVLELIEGYETFLKKYPNEGSRLLIVGLSEIPSKYEKKVIAKCKRIGDNVIYSNKVEAKRMAEIVACADVVTIPTLDEESFGMVAIEAMAMGKPVIATRSGALTEILTDDNAILVSKENYLGNAFSESFRIFMNDEERKIRGENSRRLFVEKGEWHKDLFYKNFCMLLGMTRE